MHCQYQRLGRLVVAIVLLLGVSAHASDKTRYIRLEATIDQEITSEIVQGFSGVVLVSAGGEIILERGYGELGGHKFKPDSRFRISSTAKQFESAAILLARDRGLLKLDDPLSRFFPDAPTDKRDITVRQLLTHNSGFGQSYVSEQVLTGSQAASAILAEPLASAPNQGFRYSNNNYQLAAAIVEIISGQDYQAFLKQEFFEPLGLANTGQGGPYNNARIAPTLNPLPSRLRTRYWGGQSMYATAADLWRWTEALRFGRILSPDSTKQLFSPVVAISEGFGAMGWFGGETEGGIRRIFTRELTITALIR